MLSHKSLIAIQVSLSDKIDFWQNKAQEWRDESNDDTRWKAIIREAENHVSDYQTAYDEITAERTERE